MTTYAMPGTSGLLTPIDGAQQSAVAPRPHRILTAITGSMIALTVVFLLAGLFDDRLVLGQPVWNKPLKFSVSIWLYLWTLGVLLRNLKRYQRAATIAATGIAVLLLVEMIGIAGAAAFGTTSHFNDSTPVHAALYYSMGASIAVAWMLSLVVGVIAWRNPTPDRAWNLAVRFGVVIGLIGMALAIIMTVPGPTREYAVDGMSGGHGVGVVDGGPGLPFLGWSTVGGDFRVPHFVGLHALQLLPLAVLLLNRLAHRFAPLRPARNRATLAALLGTAYAGIVGLTTWQAWIGQSVIHPSGAILWSGLVLVAVLLLGSWWILTSKPAPAARAQR